MGGLYEKSPKKGATLQQPHEQSSWQIKYQIKADARLCLKR